MPDEIVAVDLTSLSPLILPDGAGAIRESPSFCMPWFAGEPPIVGPPAQLHRRGSALNGVGEARFSLAGAFSSDAARHHLSEGWLRLCSVVDDLQRPNTEFRWSHSDQGSITTFEKVIETVLAGYVGRDVFLSFVVPDALGVGGQQLLLDSLEPKFGRVQLVPRSIAAAMAWCLPDKTPSKSPDQPSDRFVVVATGGADQWELSYVRLSYEQSGHGLVACPVRDITKSTSNVSMSGLNWELARLIDSGMEPAVAWLALLLDEPSRLRKIGTPQPESLEQSEKWLDQIGVPTVEAHGSGPSDFQNHLRAQGMPASGVPEALIYSGLTDQDLVPEFFQELVDAWPSASLMNSAELIVHGAAEVAKRLDLGIPSYFETLIPLEMFVRKLNSYGDPVPGWKALIESDVVEAGTEYESSSPITGLWIPENEASILLCLKRQYRGEERLRHANTSVRKATPSREHIIVSAKTRPGQGFARVNVESVNEGVFKATLNWRTMDRKTEPPTIKYGWPPGVAKVVEAPELCELANEAMLKFAEAVENRAAIRDGLLTELLNNARETLNKWMTKVSFEIKFDVAPTLDPSDSADHNFIYFGPIASHLKLEDSTIASAVGRFTRAVLQSKNRVDRYSMIYCASWFYQMCPRELIDEIASDFEHGSALHRSHLSFAGNVFSRPEDMKVFFRRFCKQIRSPKKFAPNDWLRAYRNIARFRQMGVHPDVLSKEDQDTITMFVHRTLKEECDNRNFKVKFSNCLYVLPHMLKRRRHDGKFLNPDVGLGQKIERLLLDAVKQSKGNRAGRPKPGQAKRAQAIVDFLRFEASESTLVMINDVDDE